MRHTHCYIVEPINGRYNNKKSVADKELILNTSIEDHKFVNRNATIIALPIVNENEYLQIGDEVIIHHNVFRRYYDVRGKEKNSKSFFEEDKYFCYHDQIFLYKRNNKWYTPPGFCFVKPIHSFNSLDTNKEEPLTGVLKHIGSDLKAFGLSNNDLIGFTPNSEYEFVIDNERLYRVPLNSISIKYERKGTEVEYNTSWV
tara:strand:- start:2894 stop:3493 length:600 start_codon:yes stop_codon:yes gene_type:complete